LHNSFSVLFSNWLKNYVLSSPTACVTRKWVGLDSVRERKKLEARKNAVNMHNINNKTTYLNLPLIFTLLSVMRNILFSHDSSFAKRFLDFLNSRYTLMEYPKCVQSIIYHGNYSGDKYALVLFCSKIILHAVRPFHRINWPMECSIIKK